MSIFVRAMIFSLRFPSHFLNLAFHLAAQTEAKIKPHSPPCMSYLVKSAESIKQGYFRTEYYDTVAYLLFFIMPFTFT